MKLIAFSLCVFLCGVMLGAHLRFRQLEQQPVRVIPRPQYRLNRSQTEEKPTVPFTVPATEHFTI